MKIRIKDRRDRDTQLVKKPIETKPSGGFDQRIINFVKKLSVKPIETFKITDLNDKRKVSKYLTNMFVSQNPNLRQQYGLILSIIDRYFDYEIVIDEPIKKVTEKEVTKKHEQLNLKFEQYFVSVLEKYRN